MFTTIQIFLLLFYLSINFFIEVVHKILIYKNMFSCDCFLSVCAKAKQALKKLLDSDEEVDVEFNLIKNAIQQERVCYLRLVVLSLLFS